MPPGDAARLLHRLTSYEPAREWTAPVDDPRVRHDLVPNDPATWPSPFKRYADAGLGRLALTRGLPRTEMPATALLAGEPAPPPTGLDSDALARLLFLCAGVVRVIDRNGRRVPLRAAGSAGARFPLEVYVAARGVAGVPDGVHWYDADGHALVAVAPAPADGETTIVVTGIPWRTGWRYAERGYRHLYWDAGTMLAQLLAAAASAGLTARLRTTFPDARVAGLVGADGVHEFPLAIVTLGDGAPAIAASSAAAAGEVDAAPMEFPLVTATQRAGDGDRLGSPWDEGAPLPGDPPPSRAFDDVVLQRGSTRRLTPGAAVPRDTMEWALRASLRGIDLPHFVVVHAVEGLEAGIYRWPDAASPLRTGDLRAELLHFCLDQGLGADASYVVLAATDLGALRDDRAYREVQLAAGLVEGRLHLAAYAQSLGASGMTFLDSEVEALLGEPLAGLLLTCVGVPEYANRAGGPPGRPVTVRTPKER